jgi:hypothetical protein
LATGNRFHDSGDTGGVSILLGNGDGTFQSHVEYDKSVGAYSMTMGDFNRDGKLDLIFFPGAGLVFLEGNGDGTFQSPQTFPADANAVEALITADLNGDGKLDLIAADYNGGAYVLLGNGDGTFQSPVEYASGHIGVDVVAADFNADGNLDLVLTSQNDAPMSCLAMARYISNSYGLSNKFIWFAAGTLTVMGRWTSCSASKLPVVFLRSIHRLAFPLPA